MNFLYRLYRLIVVEPVICALLAMSFLMMLAFFAMILQLLGLI